MSRPVGRPPALPPVEAPDPTGVPQILTSTGACGRQPEAFDDERRVEDAKLICAGCPVRECCLAYAMDSEEYGVWGGLTPEERDATRGRPFRYSLEQRRAAARLRHQFALGMTHDQIAADWGVSARTVDRASRRLGRVA